MKVSVLIPTYQEAKYIGRCLESLIANDFDFATSGSEILVIDGYSTDGTREIIAQYVAKYSFIRLLDNPKTVQVVALNIGLAAATGDIIIRCDAHSEYPSNYISELVKWHKKGIAANIGGCWLTLPGDDSIRAHAIASVMRHPLGVGFTYRTAPRGRERFVDTVPFGSWRRETIEALGPFDEEFIRAQDLEYNMRLRAWGLRILMLPWLRIRYYARETFEKAAQMFYQYGYWKNKVNKKYGMLSSTRQLLPPLFLFGLVALLIVVPFKWPTALYALGTYLLMYLIPIFIASFFITKHQPPERRIFSFFLLVIVAFMMAHFSYGGGYLKGFFDIFIFRKNNLPGHLNSTTR